MATRGQRTGDNAAAVLRREREALQLREAGVDYPSIATQLGYTHASAAYKAVQRALRHMLAEPAEHVRTLAVARCERMLRAVWGRVLQGDLPAIAMALRIEERRARLLGLDQADKVDVEVRIRIIARALGMDEDAAVAEAQREVATHARAHPR